MQKTYRVNPRLYLIPVITGLIIFGSVLLTYYLITSYQSQLTEVAKNDFKKSIENMIQRREGRINTVGLAITAFYEGSKEVSRDEFATFCKRLLQSTTDPVDIFVLNDNKIINSCPNLVYLDGDFDLIFPDTPIIIDSTKRLAAEYPLLGDLTLVVAFPFDFLVIEEETLVDNYKLILTSTALPGKILSETESKKGVRTFEKIEFTSEELRDAIKITKSTGLYGHKIKQNYVLDYIIWDDAFTGSLASLAIVIILTGSGVSVIIPTLIFNTLRLSESLRLKSFTLEKANERLKEIDILKDEFLSMISHELKTPLVPIQMYSEMLLRGKGTKLDQKQQNQIKKIHQSAQSLEKLIEDFLDINRLELNRLKLDKKDVEIKEFMEKTVDDLKPFVLEKNIDLILDLKGSWKVTFDPGRIFQVISNLIKNSVDFVPEKGKIIVRIEKMKNSDTLFTIEDNGIGIPPDLADDLFKKFYQVDTSVTRQHGGTGLGLSICQGIVKTHGGKIWFDKSYKDGARIQFTLPYVAKS